MLLSVIAQLLPKVNDLHGLSTNVVELTKYKTQIKELKKRSERVNDELEILERIAELDTIGAILQDMFMDSDSAFEFGPLPGIINWDMAAKRKEDAVGESNTNIFRKVLDLLMSNQILYLSTGTEIDFVQQLNEDYEVKVEFDGYDIASHVITHIKMMIYGHRTHSRYEDRIIGPDPKANTEAEIVAHAAYQIRNEISPDTETIMLWHYFYELGMTQVWIADWFQIGQSTVHDRIMKFNKFLRTYVNFKEPGS